MTRFTGRLLFSPSVLYQCWTYHVMQPDYSWHILLRGDWNCRTNDAALE